MDAEKEIKQIFFSVVLEAVISKVIALVPILGWPVIGWFFQAGIRYISGKLWDEMALFGSFLKVDFEERKKQEEYEASKEYLRLTIENETDIERLEDAKGEFRETLRNLIRINP